MENLIGTIIVYYVYNGTWVCSLSILQIVNNFFQPMPIDIVLYSCLGDILYSIKDGLSVCFNHQHPLWCLVSHDSCASSIIYQKHFSRRKNNWILHVTSEKSKRTALSGV